MNGGCMKTKKILSIAMLLVASSVMSQTKLELNQTIERPEIRRAKLSEEKVELPWTQGSLQGTGDRTHIYIPDNFDYRLINEMMSGSGFGPGNGGNDYIFEVDSIVKKIIATVSANEDTFSEVDISQFEEEVKSIGVFFLNSFPNDLDRLLAGANFSKERAILILKDSWEKMSYAKKVAFIFHEYLGVLGLERENTFISSRILSLVTSEKNIQSFNPLELRWLYSRSNADTFVHQFDFSIDKKGTITTRSGEDSFTWKINNNILFLQLSGNSSTVSFPWAKHPVTGELMQVESKLTTMDLEILKLDNGLFEIKETIKSCKNFPPSLMDSDFIEVCNFELRNTKELIGSNTLNTKRIKIDERDLVALPVSLDENTLSTHLVKIKNGNRIEKVEGYGNFKVTSLSVKNNTLNYKTSHGHKYELSIIKRQNGIDRAIVKRSFDSNNYVTIEPVVIIKGGTLPSLSNSDVIGDFLPIYSGARHTKEDQEPYSFDSDGFGGFETSVYNPNHTETLMMHWVWKYDGYKLNTKRYFYFDEWDSIISEDSRENLESCISGVLRCEVKNDRDYIILKKNGNRYTMLRLFRFYTPDYSDVNDVTMKLRSESSSLWVMDKL